MHELAITEAIVRIILQEVEKAHGSKVKRARIRVGALTGYDTTAIQFYYDILKKDNPVLAHSVLDAEKVFAKLICRDCRKTTMVDDYTIVCPECGSFNTDEENGKEIFVESIDVEENDEADKGDT